MKSEDIREQAKHIKPIHLSWPEIGEISERFRSDFVDPIDLVPVPIIEIVEFKLGIHPIPEANLKDRLDIEGFLTRDLKHMCIDQKILMDERYVNRLRFTYAHEVGHLVMHKDQISLCNFRTSEDWINFYEDISKDDLRWFESQANEFAGRLLVPQKRLMKEVDILRPMIEEFRNSFPNNNDMLIETISEKICNIFAVSYQVIVRRIRNENVFEKFGF